MRGREGTLGTEDGLGVVWDLAQSAVFCARFCCCDQALLLKPALCLQECTEAIAAVLVQDEVDVHAGFGGGDDAGNGDDDDLFAQPSSSKKQKQDKSKKQGKKGKQGELALWLRKCAMDDPALDRWLTCTDHGQ